MTSKRMTFLRSWPRPARALPVQDGHLMSQGDEFELQGEATANPEREQGTEGGQKRERANDGMVGAPKTPCFLGFLEPWVGTPARGGCAGVADQPAREADQDRCQGRAPRPLRRLPDGRSRGAGRTVRENIAADRRAATTTGSSVRPHQCVVTTGGVRPNDEAKGQIDGSKVVLGARMAEAVVETVSAADGFLETRRLLAFAPSLGSIWGMSAK